jgi:hypothetical protein
MLKDTLEVTAKGGFLRSDVLILFSRMWPII